MDVYHKALLLSSFAAGKTGEKEFNRRHFLTIEQSVSPSCSQFDTSTIGNLIGSISE